MGVGRVNHAAMAMAVTDGVTHVAALNLADVRRTAVSATRRLADHAIRRCHSHGGKPA